MLSSALLAFCVHVSLASLHTSEPSPVHGASERPPHQDSEARDWEAIRADVDAHALAALDEVLDGVRELIEQCDAQGAFSHRNRLYRFVLEHVPDDRAARKALGYRKRKGEWVQGRVKVPEDTCSAQYVDLLESSISVLAGKYLATVITGVVDISGRESSVEVDYLRDTNMRRIIGLSPRTWGKDPSFGLTFDAESEQWILTDVVEALRNRSERRAFLDALDDDLGKPESIDLDEAAAATGVTFRSTVQLGHVIVSSVEKKSAASELARAMFTLSALVGSELYEPFDRPYPAGERTEILYDLGTGEDRVAFASAHPEYDGIAPDEIFGSTGFGANYALAFGPELSDRIGDAVGMYAYAVLSGGYSGVFGVGWVQDGLMNYFAFQAAGATTTGSFINLSGDVDPDLADEMFAEGADWLALATREFSEGVEGTSLRALFATEMRDLTPRDSLLAYLFAAYLLDARPSALIAILVSWKDSEDRVELVELMLGLPVRWLDDHLIEWATATATASGAD